MVDPINISDALARAVELVENQDFDAAIEYLRSLHPADSAEVLAMLTPEQQSHLAGQLEPEELAVILEQLDEEDMLEVAEHLDMETLADVLDAMEPDMAADLLGEIDDEAVVNELLQEMEESDEVQPLLEYEEDTAGGIMNSVPPCLRRWMTVTEAFRFIKENYHDANELFYLYVLDRHGVLIGVINLRALILAEPEQTIEEIMNRDVISVRVDTDQEEVAQILSRYDLLAVPVVDEQHRLVGIITIDDVVDVIEEEATEDIYRLAQISEEAELFSPIPRAIRNRLPWLFINLGTALLSASVVTRFQGTISLVPILAAFMPVIAAQGGNAGNQTMTIVVRSLGLGEIDLSDAWPALRHEFMIGIINGLSLGLSLGLIAYLWDGSAILGVIVFCAMLLNLVIAALAGVVVPMTLKRLGVDPALGSSMFVTATTDIMGFAIFLGLATYFVMLIF